MKTGISHFEYRLRFALLNVECEMLNGVFSD
jgi:hypothetical protein